jgi:hypothetical protein
MITESRYVLFVCIIPLACGTQLRGVDPPVVDEVKFNMQLNTASQKISALKVKSLFAANSAKAAASQARTAKLKLEGIYVKTMSVMPELNAIKKDSKQMAAKANEASKGVIQIVKAMQGEVGPIIENSKKLAVASVKSLLKEKYHELDEWRHKVLTNPWEKGQVAATKAAVPYWRIMGNYGATQIAYGLESGSMKSQAAGDAANAKALAGGVEAKKEAGDVIGAAQDEEMAQALEAQSQQLKARADALDAGSAQMGKVVPIFAGQAHHAAWNAEYAANPDGLPPPPVDPNFAFTPPPPKPL